MSRTFSANLSECRRSKHVTQKEVAEALGITPSLLSHYENGIRECRIDMVEKFAAYYNVTADYLLGASESKHGAGEVFSMDYLSGDEKVSQKTILRSVIYLSELAHRGGEESEKYFNDYFSLCVKKYLDEAGGNTDVRAKFTTQALDGLSSEAVKITDDQTEIPVCASTAVSNADTVIDEALVRMMGRK